MKHIIKKITILSLGLLANVTFAKHYFNLCYYNQTNESIAYNNGGNTKSSNWITKDSFANRGTIVGEGIIQPNTNKCFQATDETLIFSHKLTFIIHNKLYSIVNPAFSKPYVIGQNAEIKSKGTLGYNVDQKAREQYYLYVYTVNPREEAANSIILSASPYFNDVSAYIKPAMK